MKKLVQKRRPAACFCICVCALLLASGCKRKEELSPDGYRLNNPEVVQLGKVLNEVSGICFNKEEGDLLAISDSKEQVFELDLHKNKLKDYPEKIVPPDSDLEDVVKTILKPCITIRRRTAWYCYAKTARMKKAPASERRTALT